MNKSAQLESVALPGTSGEESGGQLFTTGRVKRLLSFIGRRSRKPDDADELLAEAFARICARNTFKRSGSVDALIVQTALNVEIDDFRRRQKWGVKEDISDHLDACDAYPLQDEILMMRERLQRVAAGLAQLSPRTKEALLLRRLEGLSYSEIADRMQISESAVEKHVAKAVRFLMNWAADW